MTLSTARAAGVVAIWIAVCVQSGFAQHLSVDDFSSETLPAAMFDPNTSFVNVISLADLESLALANNPTLVQASAQMAAARGAAYQAGLYPNPELGYASDQIGTAGTAGELQGAYVSQEFVTGGKLRLSRKKWEQRACVAAANLEVQRGRVLNDIRVLFYRVLAAERLLAIQTQMLENAKDGVQTHREMLNLGQTNEPGMLQAEIKLQQKRLDVQAAASHLEERWRNLVTMVGLPQLQRTPLNGLLAPDNSPLQWETAVRMILQYSPELVAARQEVCHDETTVQRERVQPIPNVTVSAATGYNFESDSTVLGVTAGIPLPIFDKNRGTVRQAEADLAQARANVKRLELELTTRLASVYREYEMAWQRVQVFEMEMLPRSKQAYNLLHRSYIERRATWNSVLAAQLMYLHLQHQYVDSLLAYRQADVKIRGILLTGGLNEPPAPLSGGHIDAVPKPR